MAKLSDAEFASALFAEQGSDPTTPASGYGRLYVKADGVYFIDDAGTVTGPLGASGAIDAYTDYSASVTITQGVNLNTSTKVARYQQIGKRTHYWGYAVFSSAGTSGQEIRVPLPATPHASFVTYYNNVGEGFVEDSGTLHIPALCTIASLTGNGLMSLRKTNNDSLSVIGGSGYVFAVASGDRIGWNITYEAA